jgi:hypothetical protein
MSSLDGCNNSAILPSPTDQNDEAKNMDIDSGNRDNKVMDHMNPSIQTEFETLRAVSKYLLKKLIFEATCRER